MTYIAQTIDAPFFRGGAAELWDAKEHECILSGPYETGKTFVTLTKLHALLCLFPKSRALMVRKTYKSVVNSAVVTYEQKILPIPPSDPRCPVKKYGGEKPEFYQYPNGSRLIVGGMDNPDKFLSAEYDFIYINQAEELALDDWEKLVGRATGRAGNAPYTLVFGDCNPDAPTHWIKQRKRLRLIESRHEDNPRLFDVATGQWTEHGRRTIEILDGLTGLRYKRGRKGLWVAAEGQVYEYDPVIHRLPKAKAPKFTRIIRPVDFGFTNPFVCLWLGVDYDERLYVFRQLYMTGRTVKVHTQQIKKLSENDRLPFVTVTDHDAEDRATMEENGVSTKAADKRIRVGIEKVQERLKVAGDNKPRLYFLEDSLVELDPLLKEKFKPTCIEDEFASYVWPPGKNGKNPDEEPVDADNHAMDALRYGVMYLDGNKQETKKTAKVR